MSVSIMRGMRDRGIKRIKYAMSLNRGEESTSHKRKLQSASQQASGRSPVRRCCIFQGDPPG